MMKSIEPAVALKRRKKAIFAAIEGRYLTLEGGRKKRQSGLCSIFYGTVV
jgi:hypothetical protein